MEVVKFCGQHQNADAAFAHSHDADCFRGFCFNATLRKKWNLSDIRHFMKTPLPGDLPSYRRHRTAAVSRGVGRSEVEDMDICHVCAQYGEREIL